MNLLDELEEIDEKIHLLEYREILMYKDYSTSTPINSIDWNEWKIDQVKSRLENSIDDLTKSLYECRNELRRVIINKAKLELYDKYKETGISILFITKENEFGVVSGDSVEEKVEKIDKEKFNIQGRSGLFNKEDDNLKI